VFFSFSVLSVVNCYYGLPETKGWTYAELDMMFYEKTPTRKFKTYVFDTDGSEGMASDGSEPYQPKFQDGPCLR
jgi:hypothetical protein